MERQQHRSLRQEVRERLHFTLLIGKGEWWGSGLAKEWWDTDQDGWYDLKLQKSYERTREREVVYMRVPKTPHPVRIIDERSDR